MKTAVAFRLVCIALLACLGCSSSDDKVIPPPPVSAGGAEQTILTLISSLENRQYTVYENLFTGDFRFEFSSINPDLQQQWSGGWSRDDEWIAAWHLLFGGRSAAGDSLPAAISIGFAFGKTMPVPDTSAADPARHKVLATGVDGVIVLPDTLNPAQRITYVMTGNFHTFYLVRGDAAAELSASQPADTLHWYIYRWRDLTTALVAPRAVPTPAQVRTWGELKAAYR